MEKMAPFVFQGTTNCLLPTSLKFESGREGGRGREGANGESRSIRQHSLRKSIRRRRDIRRTDGRTGEERTGRWPPRGSRTWATGFPPR